MRILYIGSGDIGLPALTWLLDSGHDIAAVFTQPDKPAGRRMELLAPPVKELALERGIPVYQPVKLRAADSVIHIRSFAADLIVVMAYGQILPLGVLNAARIACINLHASILPRHRGAAPIQSAILAGDTESGVTVMYMDEGLDTGDILLIRRIPIRDDETGGTLHDRLAQITPGALAEAVALLEAGNAPRIPQDGAQATYAKKLTRTDGLIDWTRPSDEVARLIRAMNPWPGAFTWLPGARKLKIHAALPEPLGAGLPGHVARADGQGILVGCGAGSLLLQEVQVEGKRRMAAQSLVNGRQIAPGAILGAVA
jgi:methionyl-tRNA formyltransferase